MTELWRDIPGWEGVYAVSDTGRVKSLARAVPGRPGVTMRKRERILKPTPNRDGYLSVGLCRDNTKVTAKVHALVLLAFVGPCPEGMEACHADDVKSNNRLDNLRWDTRSANTYDRIRNGNHVQSRKTHCANGHPYDEQNTYLPPSGGRMCRTCMSASKRRFNARKKEAA